MPQDPNINEGPTYMSNYVNIMFMCNYGTWCSNGKPNGNLVREKQNYIITALKLETKRQSIALAKTL